MKNEAEAAIGALWSSRPLRVTVRGAGKERVYDLAKPFARVGSMAGSEILLAGDDAPRRGVYLHGTKEGIYCLGLEHLRESKPRGWLTSDTFVQIGPYKISCGFADNGPAPVASEVDPYRKSSSPTESPCFLATTSVGDVRQPVQRILTLVGRRHPCKIRLDHGSVSSTHCVLYLQAETLWAVDLLSVTGTRLDGKVVVATSVAPGQVLQLGKVPLAFLAKDDKRTSSIALVEADAQDDGQESANYLNTRTISNDAALERLLKHLSTMDPDSLLKDGSLHKR